MEAWRERSWCCGLLPGCARECHVRRARAPFCHCARSPRILAMPLRPVGRKRERDRVSHRGRDDLGPHFGRVGRRRFAERTHGRNGHTAATSMATAATIQRSIPDFPGVGVATASGSAPASSISTRASAISWSRPFGSTPCLRSWPSELPARLRASESGRCPSGASPPAC